MPHTTGTQIARNSLLNLIGQGLPLVVGLVAVPFIVARLSPDRFGLLSLVWVLLGSFALFNFGLGRTTTKYVAAYIAEHREDRLAALVWTSLSSQVAIGAAAAVLVACGVPLILPLLGIPPVLREEARDVFTILAISIPVVIGATALRGVLEAVQRFDLVNLVKGPQTAAIFVVPAVALAMGIGLQAITLMMAATWLVGGVIYAVFCLSRLPQLRRPAFDLSLLRELLAYSGWIAVSNLIAPAILYLDRFLIGTFVSLAAVGYYSAPYEATVRLTIFPSSLAATLFPAFSALSGNGNGDRLESLFRQSVKYLLLALGPLCLTLVVFAPQLLHAWLGPEFAARSTLVLRLFAVGILFNSLAYIPLSLLQGAGRPDLPAKFHLLEVPFYIALAWVLTVQYGIAGAAVASLLRVIVDTVLLFAACSSSKIVGLGRSPAALLRATAVLRSH